MLQQAALFHELMINYLWDFLEGSRLCFAPKEGMPDDEQHFADLGSLLHPLSLNFSYKKQEQWEILGCSRYGSHVLAQALET